MKISAGALPKLPKPRRFHLAWSETGKPRRSSHFFLPVQLEVGAWIRFYNLSRPGICECEKFDSESWNLAQRPSETDQTSSYSVWKVRTQENERRGARIFRFEDGLGISWKMENNLPSKTMAAIRALTPVHRFDCLFHISNSFLSTVWVLPDTSVLLVSIKKGNIPY